MIKHLYMQPKYNILRKAELSDRCLWRVLKGGAGSTVVIPASVVLNCWGLFPSSVHEILVSQLKKLTKPISHFLHLQDPVTGSRHKHVASVHVLAILK